MERRGWNGVSAVRQHGRRFRFLIGGGATPGFQSFATPEEAERARRVAIRELANFNFAQLEEDREVGTSLDAYDVWQRDKNGKGNKKGTADTARYRLKNFFPGKVRAMQLQRVTPALCEKLYADYCATGPAVDTHRHTLNTARTFFGWCVEKKWITKNPAADVKGTGKRIRGKQQLTIDEVRRFTDVGLWLCAYGPDALSFDGGRPARYGIGGPGAALATFYLGLRAGEVADLHVRHLDNAGTSVLVKDAKTDAGRRRQKVPDFLQPVFRLLAKDKLPGALLFGGRRWWVRDWVQRLCDLAGAPLVCAHAMRGLHIDLAISEGQTAEAVTRAVGHEYASFKNITLRHYAQAGTQQQAQAEKTLAVVRPGHESAEKRGG